MYELSGETLTLLNLLVTLGCGLSFIIYVDRRLTRVETHILHILNRLRVFNNGNN